MIISRAFAAITAGIGLLQTTIAHSVQRNPLTYITRIDDAVIHTPSHRVQALSHFDLSFSIHDRQEKIRLVLEPNHDILSDDASVQILGADGTLRRVELIDRSQHKIFKGRAFVRLDGDSEWTNAGWARINIDRDGAKPVFQGSFHLNGLDHHVQTSTTYRRTSLPGDPEIEDAKDGEYMVVWRDIDVVKPGQHDELRKRGLSGRTNTAGTCVSDELLYNRDQNNVFYRSLREAPPARRDETSSWAFSSPALLFGRQSLDNTPGGHGAGVNLAQNIGNTAGCPTTRKVALIGVVADCTYIADFGGNATEARGNLIGVVSSASRVFEDAFNISIGIQNITISEATCPSSPPASAPWNRGCSNDVTISDRLNLFSQWRGQFNDNNAYWTLFTKCNTGSAVGLAWLGQVCREGSSTTDRNETTAGANVVVKTGSEWQVFAHETGHTFGAVHDCVRETCADGSVERQECCPLTSSTCNAQSDFLMNPSTASGISTFSACSLGNVCTFLERNSNKATCLADNKGLKIISEQQCGNGIVEEGEDCDCGGESGCQGNPCCNPTTCKFTTGSVCDPANEECCTDQCQLKSRGTVCRASTGACDPEETCPGDSPSCPSDRSADDGTSCGKEGEGLACASGQCTSRNQQCKTLMGSLTTNNDTYACQNSGCMLSCASPEFGINTCYTMRQYFLDGTPCEGGGKCFNGNCEGSNLGTQITDLFKENQHIIVPVIGVVGGLIVIAIISCIWSSCARRRRLRKLNRNAAAAASSVAGAASVAGSGRSGWGGGRNGGYHQQIPSYPTPQPYQQQTAHQPGMEQMRGQPGGRYEPMREPARTFRYA